MSSVKGWWKNDDKVHPINVERHNHVKELIGQLQQRVEEDKARVIKNEGYIRRLEITEGNIKWSFSKN